MFRNRHNFKNLNPSVLTRRKEMINDPKVSTYSCNSQNGLFFITERRKITFLIYDFIAAAPFVDAIKDSSTPDLPNKTGARRLQKLSHLDFFYFSCKLKTLIRAEHDRYFLTYTCVHVKNCLEAFLLCITVRILWCMYM